MIGIISGATQTTRRGLYVNLTSAVGSGLGQTKQISMLVAYQLKTPKQITLLTLLFTANARWAGVERCRILHRISITDGHVNFLGSVSLRTVATMVFVTV